MKFECNSGRRVRKEVEKFEKYLDGDRKTVFAFLPVKVGKKGCRWLERVVRVTFLRDWWEDVRKARRYLDDGEFKSARVALDGVRRAIETRYEAVDKELS